MKTTHRLLAFCLLISALQPFSPSALSSDLAWPAVTTEAKPWTRWWWLGSAVDEKNLASQLKLLADAGIGGVEITPIYGAKGYEDRFIPFLSPRYVDMLGFTVTTASKLGLKVDMATGTGWPFGGPQVRPEDAELRIAFDSNGNLVPKPTNFHVKRSAPGGEGLVLNPYSTAALAHYLEPFTAALSKLPRGAIHGQFQDSFEYQANWAAELPAAFEKMHGYKLTDHAALIATKDSDIAALSPADADKLARIKSDYRETLAALHMDYIRAWVDWSHTTGGVAREQAHGSPTNLIDAYALADIPETETFGAMDFPIPNYRALADERADEIPQLLVSRLASSAAHLSGKPLSSSETFTWSREHFHEAPSELKPEVDALFLTGINHVFWHGNAYSPDDAPWPGWLFYASTQFNPRNSMWDGYAALNTYIARVQSFLQMGEPDNDVLVYWPIYDLWNTPKGWNRNFTMHDHSWFEKTPTGELAQALTDTNVCFDFVSDGFLSKAEVKDGAIILGSHAYGGILIPETTYMPETTMAALMGFVKKGVFVGFMGQLPKDVPGLSNYAERHAAFDAIFKKIDILSYMPDGSKRGRAAMYEKSPIMFVILDQEPFIKEAASANKTLGLRFTRLKYNEGLIFFVSNLSAQSFDDNFVINRRFGGMAGAKPYNMKTAALFDPRSDASGIVPIKIAEDNRTQTIRLQLDPGESVIIKASTTGDTGPAWKYRGPPLAQVPPVSFDKSEWHVTFTKGDPALPPAYTTTKLASWTEQGGEAERFAGTARYETTFDIPANVTASDWELNLGDVRELARVFVNGQQVDYLWSLPFRAFIGKYVKPGPNTLAIEVTNLSANRIRDMDKRGEPWKNFHEINFVNVHYQPLDASEWPLQPSGLLGPVTLTPLE